MTNTNIDVVSGMNAWKAGENAALDNMKVGNTFKGCMNIADALGYEQGTLDYDMAMGGALRMIRKFTVWTDKNSVILELIEA